MNCILRKWRLSDAKDLAAALNNKKILNNLRDGLPFPYTEQDARDYIIAILSSEENRTFAYAITQNDRAIGSIGAFRQSNIHRQTAELGYYLAEEYWGRGIMTEAIRQLCAIIFDTTDILRIYAEPFAYNTGSRRALEKAGFAFEGAMKNNAVKKRQGYGHGALQHDPHHRSLSRPQADQRRNLPVAGAVLAGIPGV